MTWKLFLDDERQPVDNKGWFVARNANAAMLLIKVIGLPDYMSLDHDLGDGPTGYDFAKAFVDYLMDNPTLVWNGQFYVHSQNPIGAKNIEEYLRGYILNAN